MSNIFSVGNERFQREEKTNLGLHWIYEEQAKSPKFTVSSFWQKKMNKFYLFYKTKFWVSQLLNEHKVANLRNENTFNIFLKV